MHFLLLVVRPALFARPAAQKYSNCWYAAQGSNYLRLPLRPAPLAPQAGHNYSNGCRLGRGRICWSWLCAPRPWCPYCPNYSNGARLRRGRILCYWPCVLGTLLPSFVPMGVGCAGVAFYAPSPAPARLAPQAARNTATDCRLRSGCTSVSWPCAQECLAQRPRPWRHWLPQMTP